MRKLFTILMLLVGLDLAAQTLPGSAPYVAYFQPVNFSQQPSPNRLCKTTAWGIGYNISNAPVVSDVGSWYTDASGWIYFTNPIVANYMTVVSAPPQTTTLYWTLTNALSGNLQITNFSSSNTNFTNWSVAALQIANISGGSSGLSGSFSGGVLSLTNTNGPSGTSNAITNDNAGDVNFNGNFNVASNATVSNGLTVFGASSFSSTMMVKTVFSTASGGFIGVGTGLNGVNATGTNLASGLSATNLNIVSGNGAGLTNIPMGAFFDGRPKFDSSLKGSHITNGVPLLLMSNNGPSTLYSIRNGNISGSGDTNAMFNAYYTLVCDGQTNIMTNGYLLVGWSAVHPFWAKNISVSKQNSPTIASYGLCGEVDYIMANAYTNMWLTLTMTDSISGVYSDAVYASGTPTAPAQCRYWHYYETNCTVPIGTYVNFFSITNSGMVQSATFTGYSASGAQGFLEGCYAHFLDGASFTANGMEDYFQATDYGEGRCHAGDDTGYWCVNGSGAGIYSPFYPNVLNPNSSLILGYRFNLNLPFTNTYTFGYTNLAGPNQAIVTLYATETHFTAN